jgi:hypothetical protein
MHVNSSFALNRPSTRSKGFLLSVTALATIAILVTVGCGTSNNTTQSQQNQNTINKALWVANGTNVVEFIPSQLAAGSPSNAAPHLAINSSVFGAPQGVTFDANGNLWVIDGGTVSTGGTVMPSLEEFSAAQLQQLHSNNAPAPNVQIQSSSFTFPQQAVFDILGNLWVSDNGANAVYVFTPQQLAASSTVIPTITITSNPVFSGPLGITFDSTGDLWVANNASTTIYKFAITELPTSAGTYTLTPSVILSDDGNGSIQAPWALIFDSKGDLYSSNANTPFTLVAFSPSQLMQTGSPVPTVTISPATVNGNASLSSPNGIAFDNLGDLAAISSVTPFGSALYGANQASMSGTLSPNTLLVGTTTTLNAPAGCNFGPVVN